MLALLGIGLALTLGIGMRVAAAAGFVLYVMMWTVALPPENHPVLDEHILGAISMVVLAAYYAGDTWGLGKRWAATKLVKEAPSSGSPTPAATWEGRPEATAPGLRSGGRLLRSSPCNVIRIEA